MFAWLFGSSTRAPVLLELRSSKTFIIITVSLAVFADIFVYGIVVPVLPFALTSRANIDPSQIQTWISIFLAVYGGALLITAPICGYLADRSSSRRMPMILGLVALGGATVMLCVGNSIAVLAVGRVLQGISAAVPWIVGLALLVDTVGPDEVGEAMGYVGLSMSLAMLVSPLLGGIVFAHAGYYAVFAMAFGLMVLDIFLRVVMIEKKVAAKWLAVEAVESEGERASDEIASKSVDKDVETGPSKEILHEGHAADDRDKEGMGLENVTSKLSAAEEVLPGNTPNAIKRFTARLPPVIFLLASRRVLSALWACMIQASLLTAFDSILPLFVRDTFHWNSTGAGLIFLPLVAVSFLGPVFGRLSDKHGSRWYATAGFVLCCPFLILLRLVRENTLGQKALLCALLALVGLCLAMLFTPMMAEIAYAVDAKAQRRPPGFFGKNGAYAQAYSLFNVAWAGGCLVGPLLAGLVQQSYGWGTATLILGCISIFTALPTGIWTGGSIFKKARRRKEERKGADMRS